jgi:hypothetical protein
MNRRESRPGGTETAPTTSTVDAPKSNRQCTSDALRRRRAASQRLTPLVCGHSDPWRPWGPKQLSDKQAEGAAQAAEHLLAVGLVPLFDAVTLRAMWRAGNANLAHALRGNR